jgi:hypothetical protein
MDKAAYATLDSTYNNLKVLLHHDAGLLRGLQTEGSPKD